MNKISTNLVKLNPLKKTDLVVNQFLRDLGVKDKAEINAYFLK